MLEKTRPPPKQALYEQLARVGKAVAAPRRLELLDLLSQAPRTVEGLADQTGMSVANTSQHLHVLRAAGLVQSEKDGTFVTYRLASDAVADCSSMCGPPKISRLATSPAPSRSRTTP
jgi:DNA-binding transcriptional ArsR family regulator